MTPLARDDGTTVLVNHGFVSATQRDPASWRPRSPEPVTMTDLLRVPEPGVRFRLRAFRRSGVRGHPCCST
jgi:surfeit locus 1 family protein